MAIGFAIEQGTVIMIYDENGRTTGMISCSDHSNGDGLKGYSSSTVSVKFGDSIKIFGERGQLIRQISVSKTR